MTGGSDCPELALTGMIDALKAGPRLGSPMFVFTDASPKDDTVERKQELKALADKYSTSISFFANLYGCGGRDDMNSFKEIATHTSGNIFPIRGSDELLNFKDYVSNSLRSDTVIAHGSHAFFNRRGKRFIASKTYLVLVDDGVTHLHLSLSVNQRRTTGFIKLTDPAGKTHHAQSSSSYTKVYKIINPTIGTWTLLVPPTTGEISFIAKVESDNPIDIAHRFLHQQPGDQHNPVLSISDPLEGNLIDFLIVRSE